MKTYWYTADFGVDGTTDETDGAVVVFIRGRIKATTKADAARRVRDKYPDLVEVQLTWEYNEDGLVMQQTYRQMINGHIVPLRNPADFRGVK